MKIGYNKVDLAEGKIKYLDHKLNALVKKHNPKKVAPFYVEFLKEDFTRADVIITADVALIDILINDLVICENRLERSDNESEKVLLKKCIQYIENEIPLCDGKFTEGEIKQLKKLALLSFKPIISVKETPDENELIEKALQKAGIIFFYTAGPKEVHSWPINKGTNMITCAAKIHTDLARGFIRGDVVKFDDYIQHHNFNECKSKGIAQVVDKDHIIEDGNIIEIRFNV